MKDNDSTTNRNAPHECSAPDDDCSSPQQIRIDCIDSEILALLGERGDLTYELAKQFGRLNKPYFEPARDQGKMLVLHQQWNKHQDSKFPRQGLNSVFREILSVCASIIRPQRIAYMGPPGTFSHLVPYRPWFCATAN